MRQLVLLSTLISCIKNDSYFQSNGILYKEEILLSCNDNGYKCELVGSTMSGTASRVKWKDRYYWLTAAHVCQNFMPNLLPLNTSIKIIVAGSNVEENPSILKVDTTKDLCLLSANEGPYKELSRRHPKPGDKISIIAYPSGVFDPDMLPVYDGRWNGEFKQENKCMFTVPVTGGSSGAAVTDNYGDVISVISSVSREFNHMSIGPCYDDLVSFMPI